MTKSVKSHLEETLRKLEAQAEERMREVDMRDCIGVTHADISNKIRTMVRSVGVMRGEFEDKSMTREDASSEFLGIINTAFERDGHYSFILNQPVYEKEVVEQYVGQLEAENAELDEQKKQNVNDFFRKVIRYAPKDLDDNGKKIWFRTFLSNFRSLKERYKGLEMHDEDYQQIIRAHEKTKENKRTIETIKKIVGEDGAFYFERSYEYSNTPLRAEIKVDGRVGRNVYPALRSITTIIGGLQEAYMKRCRPEHLTFKEIRESESDIDRLKRENEELRRENGMLKDNYRKLEEMYNHVQGSGENALAVVVR